MAKTAPLEVADELLDGDLDGDDEDVEEDPVKESQHDTDVRAVVERAESEARARAEAESQKAEADEEPEDLPPALLEEMNNAYNYWHSHGYPEKASVIWECIQQKRRPPANLIPGHVSGIRPETNVDPETLTMPTKTGKTGSTKAWQDFAKLVLDMEDEVIDALGRQDLINIMRDKGVISLDS